jgi:hypothetical protein
MPWMDIYSRFIIFTPEFKEMANLGSDFFNPFQLSTTTVKILKS